ncbi:MAG: large repetitive protein, partial [Frankiaceae bacterium]|nr:large repetitive protein [Frankiaceae bacterium]
AVLQSEWLNQAGVTLSGTLSKLRPVVQGIAAVITDIDSGNVLKAMFEIPTTAVKLGVSLPAPYGTAFASISAELDKINDGLSVLGKPFQYGLNDVLNGFDMNFPGIPGTVIPRTCITTWDGGNCYTTPPWHTLFGTVPGIPGVIVPATCITTTVNGTCYSVPPFSAGHIPGICDALRSAISGLNCSSGGLTDSLLLPALRAILKSSSGYDIGDVKLVDALNAIQTSLSNGKTFSIDCASFSAAATLGSAPTANVSLSTNLNVFGSQLTPQMTWNFAPDTSNLGTGIQSVLDAIIHPNLNLHGTCALPADWNTNPDFPDAVGTAVSLTGGQPTQPTQPVIPPAPVMNTHLAASAINEGDTATLTGSITPAPATPQTVTIDWGNGTPTTATTGTGGSFTTTQRFPNNTPAGQPSAQYPVKATAGTLSVSTMLTVSNVAPANLTATPSATSINEGSAVTVSGSFTDPGADGHTVTFTWGDGGSDTRTLAAGVRTYTSPSHTYADNNRTAAGYPVTVTVTDDDLATTTASFTQNVANAAPSRITVAQLAPPGGTCPSAGCAFGTPEQQAVPFSVSFADPGTNDSETAVVDWGDGNIDTINVGTQRSFVLSHVWIDMDVNSWTGGRFPINVRVTDSDGAAGTGTAVEPVTNVAPTNLSACLFNSASTANAGATAGASCPSTATIAEGGTASLQGNFTDLSAYDTHTVRIDWGAGWPTAERYQTLTLPIGTTTFNATRQFGGDGTFPIVVTVADDHLASANTTSTLTVTQVKPTVVINRTAATVVQGVPAFITRAGTSLPVQAGAADPGNDALSVLWNWQDGTTTSNTYAGVPKSTPSNPHVAPQNVTDSRAHSWAMPCVYATSVLATDGDGNSALDQADTIVTGTDASWRSAGYWQGLYKNRATAAQLCQLTITQRMSATFAGPSSRVGTAPVALRTAADAANVLQPSSSDERMKLRRAILTMWLDYANGAVGYGQLIDTNGDKRPDTAFSVVMANAERVGLNPTAAQAQLKDQRQLLAKFIGD